MTWCSKIYDIFNGWSDDENDIPSLHAHHHHRHPRSVVSKHELHRQAADKPRILVQQQHTSPYLERSKSMSSSNQGLRDQLYNTDYLNSRDYRGEHACADTLFSCHQRDGQYDSNPEQRPYGIATISNTSLNLSKYMGNTEDKLQQLSRSYSLELPTDMKRTPMSLPSMNDLSPRVRYSMSRHRMNLEKANRLSLNSTPMNASQMSLQNRKDPIGYRISTRSTYSVPEYESNELSARNNEQIERTIQMNIKEMFKASPNGVFPMVYRLPADVLIPSNDHYRTEGGYGEPSQWIIQTKISSTDCRITSDNVASVYAAHFYDQFHYNLYGIDADFNPVVMSIKPHENKLLVVVRTKEGSKSVDFVENEINSGDYVWLSKQLYPNLQIDHFDNCTHYKAQQHVKAFDEKLEIQKFKFGVIYQRRGQTTEEEFFNNDRHNRTFDEFLDIIATRVSLKNFKGYRAGLDVSEQTDSPISYYELFDQKEIMFHVSTLLPFTPNDSAQIQRKRHIGNDIVAIVFQEENTPFHPTMIKSNFLHVFLVVQPVQVLSRTCYKMMLIARDDIQEFPPALHSNVVFVRTAEQLKPFILSKLINAEYAAYRCRTFSLLQERTRCSYLKTLCENLSEKSYEILCDESKRDGHRRSSLLSNSGRKRYLSSMKKMFSRSNSTPDGPRQSIKSDPTKHRSSKKLLRLGRSMDTESPQRSSIPEHRNGRSDESLNSSGDLTSSTVYHHRRPHPVQPPQVYYGDESDEGLDSMSSADTPRVPYDSDDQDAYRQQLREKSHPTHIWHRVSNQRSIYTPQTAGIHISEAATV